jgi:hypothetical protein
VRRFQDGVTTTAPSLPMQLGTVPVLSPTMASAADGRQSSLTGDSASNRHANMQSLRNARNTENVQLDMTRQSDSNAAYLVRSHI